MRIRASSEQVWNPDIYPSGLSDRDEIMREIIVRLAWYDYDYPKHRILDDPAGWSSSILTELNHIVSSGAADDQELSWLMRGLSERLWPNKPRALVELEEFNKHHGSKGTHWLTRQNDLADHEKEEGSKEDPLRYSDGWVLRDHIEGNNREQSPYKNPEKVYKNFLPRAPSVSNTNRIVNIGDVLIDINSLNVVQMRRHRTDPNKWTKGNNLYTQTVYRLVPHFGGSPEMLDEMMRLLTIRGSYLDPRFVLSPYWAKYGDQDIYVMIQASILMQKQLQKMLILQSSENVSENHTEAFFALHSLESGVESFMQSFRQSDTIEAIRGERKANPASGGRFNYRKILKQARTQVRIAEMKSNETGDTDTKTQGGHNDQESKCPRRNWTDREQMPPNIASRNDARGRHDILVLNAPCTQR